MASITARIAAFPGIHRFGQAFADVFSAVPRLDRSVARVHDSFFSTLSSSPDSLSDADWAEFCWAFSEAEPFLPGWNGSGDQRAVSMLCATYVIGCAIVGHHQEYVSDVALRFVVAESEESGRICQTPGSKGGWIAAVYRLARDRHINFRVQNQRVAYYAALAYAVTKLLGSGPSERRSITLCERYFRDYAGCGRFLVSTSDDLVEFDHRYGHLAAALRLKEQEMVASERDLWFSTLTLAGAHAQDSIERFLPFLWGFPPTLSRESKSRGN